MRQEAMSHRVVNNAANPGTTAFQMAARSIGYADARREDNPKRIGHPETELDAHQDRDLCVCGLGRLFRTPCRTIPAIDESVLSVAAGPVNRNFLNTLRLPVMAAQASAAKVSLFGESGAITELDQVYVPLVTCPL